MTSAANVAQAVTYLNAFGRPVEAAWARCVAGGGSRTAVIAALSAFQNEDGGFGRTLEVDIAAPESQPFATRLAMLILISIGAPPSEPMIVRLSEWLEREQGEDGCWRLPETVFARPLAPWFAEWTFPSLNPALCLAGACQRLGIGSPRLFGRAAALVERMGAVEEIAMAQFYEVLPYAEYVPWVEHPDRERYLDALALRIEQVAREGGYDDALHFFEHLGPADGELAARVAPAIVIAQLDRLRREQQPDGGWPTPYHPLWRSWVTAEAVAVLVRFGGA